MMRKLTLMSAAVCLRAVPSLLLLLQLLLTCSFPPLASASDALPGLEDFTSPYRSILSPLLRALSEHGGSRWSSGLRGKMKPEHMYMKYLMQVYKKSSRAQRSTDGDKVHNTIRLIKPQEECLTQSSKELFLQELSYSLDQVRGTEQLLRSALLYNLDREFSVPVRFVCYLCIKKRDQSNQCQLCDEVHQTLNFTNRKKGSRNWAEVDVTQFFQHSNKPQRNVRLLVGISCAEEQKAGSNVSRELLELILRSPPLVLYLNDKSKAPQRSLSVDADQRPSGPFQKQRHGCKRRWKRESPKSPDVQLPELLPSSEFPTTDCALYDFRVRFSQLKLDHWIVFPPKYNPRYCRGICPRTMGFIYGSPVHTMVQNIIYEKLDSSVPRPSCVPSHYSPLSVMIFEEDGSYVYKEFKDMVATRCTCR